jgi:hypothetical protein
VELLVLLEVVVVVATVRLIESGTFNFNRKLLHKSGSGLWDTRQRSPLQDITKTNMSSFNHRSNANPIAELERLEKLAERQISILQRRVVDTEAAYIEDSRMRNGGCSVLTGWEGYMDRKAADLMSASNVSKYRGAAEDRIFSRSSALLDPSQNRITATAAATTTSSSSSSSSSTSSSTITTTTTTTTTATTAPTTQAKEEMATTKTGKNKGKRGKTKGKGKETLDAAAAEVVPPEVVAAPPQRGRSRSSSRTRKMSDAEEERIVGKKFKKTEKVKGRGRGRPRRKRGKSS